MEILVDADACPVNRLIEENAEKWGIPVIFLCDINHELYPEYGRVKTIGAGADAVDFALINLCHANDVVVTQDYGLAAMVLSKRAFAIHPCGRWYTEQNMDRLLMERHLNREARRSSSRAHKGGQKKRTKEEDQKFERSFLLMLEKALEQEKGLQR